MRFKSIFVGIFFGLLLVLGLAIYKDYGLPWDEPIQRTLGVHAYEYVTGQNEKLLKNSDRFYGQNFEIFLVSLEKLFSLTDPQHVYQMRHLANYFLFVLGAFFFFLLLHHRLRSIWWGLLGATFLVLSPRIFADAFYNSKDLAFLSVFIISTYVSVIFMEKKTFLWAILAALVGGLLIGLRVLGVILPFLVVGLFFSNTRQKRDFKLLVIYLVTLAFFIVLFWPILWQSPVANFIEAFNYYPQKTAILFFGKEVISLDVPWYYTIGWIVVTTPYTYLLLFLLGIWHFIERIPNVIREDLLMLGWFSIPLVATIVLGSVLYDAWRQMFFIYPPILYFSILGIAKASPKVKRTLFFLLAINIFSVVSFMVNNHPFQNVYFNEFVKPPYEKKFILDYWGLSYKGGYEYIAKTDERELITVFADGLPGEKNLLMLPKKDRDRFKFVPDKTQADYYLTTYRSQKELFYEPAYYEIKVGDTRILGVHKLSN